MELGIQNILFGMASSAIPLLLLGYFVAWLVNKHAEKSPITRSHLWTFTVVVLVASFIFSYTTYGPRVKATGLNTTPSIQYDPQRQEVVTGGRFIDSGPSRMGQFTEELEQRRLQDIRLQEEAETVEETEEPEEDGEGNP